MRLIKSRDGLVKVNAVSPLALGDWCQGEVSTHPYFLINDARFKGFASIPISKRSRTFVRVPMRSISAMKALTLLPTRAMAARNQSPAWISSLISFGLSVETVAQAIDCKTVLEGLLSI